MYQSIDGKYIQSFISVYEQKNMSRAAEELGYVQSTVTHHIQQLEHIIGQPLFIRLARQVQPTEVGKQFVKYAYQYRELGEQLQADLRELEGVQGTVSVMMQEAFYMNYMLEVIDNFEEHYPSIQVDVRAGYYHDVVAHLSQFAIDFGILPMDPQRQEIIFQPLFEEEMVFVRGHQPNKEEHPLMASLTGETLLTNGKHCVYASKAIEVLSTHQVKVKQVRELPSIAMIKHLVAQGKGFTLLPRVSVRDELLSGSLIEITVDTPLVYTHGLAYHKQRESKQIRQLFEAFVNQELKMD